VDKELKYGMRKKDNIGQNIVVLSRREGHIQRTPSFTFSESGGIGYLGTERD
jgi:hypothetical protein